MLQTVILGHVITLQDVLIAVLVSGAVMVLAVSFVMKMAEKTKP